MRAHGYLWVGTIGGLARFDGSGSSLWRAEFEGISEQLDLGLYESRRGDLWITSDGGGMTRYHEGRFTNYGIPQGIVERISGVYRRRIRREESGCENRFMDGLNRWQEWRDHGPFSARLAGNLNSWTSKRTAWAKFGFAKAGLWSAGSQPD